MPIEKISDHFSRHEFECQNGQCPHCGGVGPVDRILIFALEELRYKIHLKLNKEVPLIINSAFRCNTYNRIPKSEGGPGSNDRSQHPRGTAVDIALVPGMDAEDMRAIAETIGSLARGGIILYDTFIHLDVRTGPPYRGDNRTDA